MPVLRNRVCTEHHAVLLSQVVIVKDVTVVPPGVVYIFHVSALTSGCCARLLVCPLSVWPNQKAKQQCVLDMFKKREKLLLALGRAFYLLINSDKEYWKRQEWSGRLGKWHEEFSKDSKGFPWLFNTSVLVL